LWAFGGSNPDVAFFALGIPLASVLVWTSSAGQPDFRLQEVPEKAKKRQISAIPREGENRPKIDFICIKS